MSDISRELGVEQPTLVRGLTQAHAACMRICALLGHVAC
jgi:hypothetical protein